MSPYRKMPKTEEVSTRKRPLWRTFCRKLLIIFYGSFKKRKSDKCHQCGKRSSSSIGSTRSYKLNYFDCGHQRYPGIRIFSS